MGGKMKVISVSERKTLQVKRPWLRDHEDYVEVDVCAECAAIVFDPIYHYGWHRKQEK